jgi:XTP/dITP diphosphohydrolase
LLVASRNHKKLAELHRVLDSAGVALTLLSLDDVTPFDEARGAAFVSACALVYRSGDAREETVVRGRWPGTIVREPRGAGGFGYDPVFLPQGWWRTAAELSPEQKDSVSHRGRALSALLPALRELAPG